jgi:PTH1 family peptidyl-tRNA hydrolase
MDNGRLVVGLGNPGAEYASTRHNAGFLVAEELFSRHGGTTWQEKWKGAFAGLRIGGLPVVLLRPLTFMNRSGLSVARAAGFQQIAPPEIVVVHDDLDLEFGSIRVKVGGGMGGHKGLLSLKADLGSADFIRVRIGIGRPVHGTATDFVLQRFRPDEIPILTNVIARAADAVESVIVHGTSRAMNEFNQRGGEKDEL